MDVGEILTFLVKLFFLSIDNLYSILRDNKIEIPLDYFQIAVYFFRVLILCIIAYWGAYKFIITPRRIKWRYIERNVGNDYKEYLSTKSQRLYIDTYFQGKPPYIYADLKDSLSDSRENMIKAYLERVLVKENSGRLYCVLGGSGMGKTSFLVNLLCRYVTKYRMTNKPYEIQLINLAKEGCLEQINELNDKSRTILLLDALDENNEAVNNYDSFIIKLEKVIEPFPIVVISCRTQFFPDEEHELKESKIRNFGKEKGFINYTRHYISPFSNNDIQKYLRKKYTVYFIRKHKARAIIDNCSSLIHRPLLLSYIDDLIDDKNINYSNILDIYETLIDKWIIREVSAHDNSYELSNKLREFSESLALNMYQSRDERGGYCISKRDTEIILKSINSENICYEFKGRSLINRDAKGDLKFSHKSFLEYYLAKLKFDKFVGIEFEGMEVAAKLYSEMCMRDIRNYVANNEIKLSKTFEILYDNDALVINTPTSFDIRHIGELKNITTLQLDHNLLPSILDKLPYTSISYIKISNYKKTNESINSLLLHDTIKYISVNGEKCSNTFIKNAKKSGKSLINNDELICDVNYYDDNMPYDFRVFKATTLMPQLRYIPFKKFEL